MGISLLSVNMSLLLQSRIIHRLKVGGKCEKCNIDGSMDLIHKLLDDDAEWLTSRYLLKVADRKTSSSSSNNDDSMEKSKEAEQITSTPFTGSKSSYQYAVKSEIVISDDKDMSLMSASDKVKEHMKTDKGWKSYGLDDDNLSDDDDDL